MADANNEFPTVIGEDAVFKGELRFEKGVRLLGRLEGQVHSKGRIDIAQSATLEGEVNAGDIRVDGTVKGNLHATGKVHLSASAKLEGDLTTARLEVAEGAVFVGQCVVGANGGTKSGLQQTGAAARAAAPGEAAKERVVPQPAAKK